MGSESKKNNFSEKCCREMEVCMANAEFPETILSNPLFIWDSLLPDFK